MPTVPVVLRGMMFIGTPGQPDQGLPGSPGHPDQGLPGMPGHPDQGLPGFPDYPSTGPILPPGPVDPGYGIPLPPIISHPIAPGGGSGNRPSTGPIPPTYPVDPGYGLPLPPHVWPMPPVRPGHPLPRPPVLPTHPIYPTDEVDNSLPGGGGGGGTPTQPIYVPGHVWPPLPPSVTGTLLAFCWIVGIGWRWVVIDADASAEHPIVLPPTPAPKPG